MTTDLARAAPPGPETRRPRSANLVRAIAIAAIVAHVLAAWLVRPTGFLTGQDDAEYSILARSLRAGGYFPGVLTSPLVGVMGIMLARQLFRATDGSAGEVSIDADQARRASVSR